MDQSNKFFQEQHIPEGSTLVGYAALMKALNIENSGPLRNPTCISDHFVKNGKRIDEHGWQIFDKRYQPKDESLEQDLSFALKHESIDLLLLKKIFIAMDKERLRNYIRDGKGGTITRRAWFLFEFLLGTELDVDDAEKTVSVVDVLDAKRYFTRLNPVISKRHKIRNNLLGTALLCPIIRRTKSLEEFISIEYSKKAKELVGKVDAELIARAASFLLLADTKASFAIEGETPSQNRIERWCRAVQQSGKYKLSIEELERLQQILLSDVRFVTPGIRKKTVYLGRSSTMADEFILPEFIAAKPDDLPELMEGLLTVHRLLSDEKAGLDAVLHAAAVAFGFVYIHPFEDGNGRLHRCLIHSVLERREYTPAQMIFPISSVMAKDMTEYSDVLKAHSSPLMRSIEWKQRSSGIEIINNTSDLYRYFDCTEEAEFLYKCVAKTVTEDVPFEIDYLKRHDKAMKEIMNTVEMPDAVAGKFIMFARQNDWKLPKNRREKEFKLLSDEEVRSLEGKLLEIFGDFPVRGILNKTK